MRRHNTVGKIMLKCVENKDKVKTALEKDCFISYHVQRDK